MTTQRIGLLFVHGIGQQKPFDHLRTSVTEIAELMTRDKTTSCSVVDRTPTWTKPVGTLTAGGLAPITLTVRKGGDFYIYECHEVYWADLGGNSGLFDTIKFWIWGLGQWCAPIYRDADAAQLDKKDRGVDGQLTDRPVTQLARLPDSVAGHFFQEVRVRTLLAATGLGALLTLVSWSLIKRLLSSLLSLKASPTLLVQYVGDVRTYEERAKPGDTALSDPAVPRRVPIRRRMVTQMVAMGADASLDGWYVLAHSLGTVVAYNGLTEIGHALPNYLERAQWNTLHPRFKTDPFCALRPEKQIPFMMPARPAWLAAHDVINRKELFANLRGVLTYGSPLGKFAGLWPRIVATATDRQFAPGIPFKDGPHGREYPPPPFPDNCSWYNLRTLFDPVSGDLRMFGASEEGQLLHSDKRPDGSPYVQFGGLIPKIVNCTTGTWQVFLASHLDYLKNVELFRSDKAIRQREQVAAWLIDTKNEIGSLGWPTPIERFALIVSVILVLAALVLLTIGVIAGLGGVGWSLLGASKPPTDFYIWRTLFIRSAAPVILAAPTIVCLAGLLRWSREGWFEWRTVRGQALGRGAMRSVLTDTTKLDKGVAVNRWQAIAGTMYLATAVIACLLAAAALYHGVWFPCLSFSRAELCLIMTPVVMLFGLLAVMTQAAINLLHGPMGKPKTKGTWGSWIRTIPKW